MKPDILSCLPAQTMEAPTEPLPEGKRLLHGWTAIAVPAPGSGRYVRLVWPEKDHPDMHLDRIRQGRIRISVALDVREEMQIEAFLPDSGAVLGTFDVRFAYVFQPFEILLDAAQIQSVLREGIQLRMVSGTSPLWIFDDLGRDEARQFSAPHLLLEGDKEVSEADRIDRFLERMTSLASIQPFGWLGGCVLDGLYDLRPLLGSDLVDRTIETHLRQFMDDKNRLRYEDLYSQPADGRFSGIEDTLPVGIIAKLWPHHPIIEETIRFWLSHEKLICDGDTVSAEGSYTVAYPLSAVAARQGGRKDLALLAVTQLIARRDLLADGRDIYLRNIGRKERTFRNWARAYCWYMLGLTRTLIELRSAGLSDLPGVKELELECRRIAEVALSWRQPDGLWSVFLDSAEGGIDTSGSSGIAAALALGANHGLLPGCTLDEAKVSLSALERYLTPDGILSGVAQHNAGGEQLQRSGYRVLSQMGMGLMAQLYASIRNSVKH